MTITDAAVADEFTHLFCCPVALYPVCADCGTAGRLRDHVERRVTDLPIIGHPTRLHVRVPRFTCDNTECATRIFQQRIPALVEPRAKTTRRCSRWILQRLAIDRTNVSAKAKAEYSPMALPAPMPSSSPRPSSTCRNYSTGCGRPLLTPPSSGDSVDFATAPRHPTRADTPARESVGLVEIAQDPPGRAIAGDQCPLDRSGVPMIATAVQALAERDLAASPQWRGLLG